MTTEQDWAEDRQRFVSSDDRIAGPLAAEFVALASALLEASTVAEVLDRVIRTAKAVVPGADLVSVTLRDPERGFHTPVETEPLATRLDELQYRLDEGPCVAATRREGMGLVQEADLVASEQFPRWGPAAADLGIHGVLAVGLFPDGDAPRMGALNLYTRERGGLDVAEREVALVLAAHASTALAATQACAAADLETAQLRRALQSRDVIGQAKGILMERRGVSADEAFDILRRTSQQLNVKLAQVAETLAGRRSEL
ncbi:ANTAR domain-containing protein [Pseudonocardia kujensis]|uniref:ANTAR domain-containing protein n=1 Tax=Pseudonocardia kujensis TaxID=1128675 RepID=UPI001E6273D7|nr:ANTAR domain-containing protein [Pseudonocardia kujensis]MCE0766747.1 ANTAR domain-containing protein [Pseudonocardia kujensis]